MTEEEINKEARKYAQPYFDEAFKHTTPSVSSICEHEGKYIIDAFKEGARLALENQWISVKDDLPCNHKELLKDDDYTKEIIIYTVNGYIIISNMYKSDENWHFNSLYSVKYWMLIPKLPKEETNGRIRKR